MSRASHQCRREYILVDPRNWEPFLALSASERSPTGVKVPVRNTIQMIAEYRGTFRTWVRSPTGNVPLANLKYTGNGEALVAFISGVRSVTGVSTETVYQCLGGTR